MAALQIIDPTAAHHNYADKTVLGHVGRTSDDDAYIQGLYENTIFDPVSGE